MTNKAYFYIYKVAHARTGRITGAVFGVIHAQTKEAAQKELFLNMSINGFALQLFEITGKDIEACMGIPSGLLLSINTD